MGRVSQRLIVSPPNSKPSYDLCLVSSFRKEGLGSPFLAELSQ